MSENGHGSVVFSEPPVASVVAPSLRPTDAAMIIRVAVDRFAAEVEPLIKTEDARKQFYRALYSAEAKAVRGATGRSI